MPHLVPPGGALFLEADDRAVAVGLLSGVKCETVELQVMAMWSPG